MARIEQVNVDGTNYDVGKLASTTAPGVVQVGSGLSVTAAGVLSSSGPTRVDLYGRAQTAAYRRTVIALCEVSTTNNAEKNSFSSGRLVFHRANGLAGVNEINVQIENQYTNAYYTNFSYFANLALLSPTAAIDTAKGFRPCTFKYNNVYYGGIEVYIAEAQLSYVTFEGETNFSIFGLDYYVVPYTSGGTTHAAEILNQEVYDSLNYTQFGWSKDNYGARSLNADTGIITKNRTYSATLPNKTGTIAMTSDIPTVNNATLTIQKNGTNVQTFTANASSNVTANITVPTQTSELTNNSGFLTASTLPIVTSISSSSTDSQVPSAKCMYTAIGNVESVLQTLNSGTGV